MENLILKVKVKRVKNSFYGNPRFEVVDFDNLELLNIMKEKKYIKELKNGYFTAPDTNWGYTILNNGGVIIEGDKNFKVLATLTY